jgi:signal peptidase II
MVRRATRFFLMLLLVGMVGCDHATKAGAKAALEGRAPLDVVAGVLDLRYAENRDTAFSLSERFHGAWKGTALLVFAAIALTAVVVAWWRRRNASLLEQAGFALILAGAVGNVADRLLRGYVVDFIHLAHWPVFNVADAAISIGVPLLFLAHRQRKGPVDVDGAGSSAIARRDPGR